MPFEHGFSSCVNKCLNVTDRSHEITVPVGHRSALRKSGISVRAVATAAASRPHRFKSADDFIRRSDISNTHIRTSAGQGAVVSLRRGASRTKTKDSGDETRTRTTVESVKPIYYPITAPTKLPITQPRRMLTQDVFIRRPTTKFGGVKNSPQIETGGGRQNMSVWSVPQRHKSPPKIETNVASNVSRKSVTKDTVTAQTTSRSRTTPQEPIPRAIIPSQVLLQPGDDPSSTFTVNPKLDNLPGLRVHSRSEVEDLNAKVVYIKNKWTKNKSLNVKLKMLEDVIKLNVDENKPSQPPNPCSSSVRVIGVYMVDKRIGSGSFGDIYSGWDTSKGNDVAIKLEHIGKSNPHLLHETRMLLTLKPHVGIPKIYWAGVTGEFSAIVMEKLGPSLEHCFQTCSRKLSLSVSLFLCRQMVSRIQEVHESGIIHRDIKPHNFCLMPLESHNHHEVRVIDFGLSMPYINEKGEHIPKVTGKSLTGTARYVSVRVHQGYEQSRRDDLESIVYVLIYFVKGSLPWQGIKGDNKQRYSGIAACKERTTPKKLCKGLPQEIVEILLYCRYMKFTETPDYLWINSKLDVAYFKVTGRHLQINHPPVFDWEGKRIIKKLR